MNFATVLCVPISAGLAKLNLLIVLVSPLLLLLQQLLLLLLLCFHLAQDLATAL
jgi:hypothetical protein